MIEEAVGERNEEGSEVKKCSVYVGNAGYLSSSRVRHASRTVK